MSTFAQSDNFAIDSRQVYESLVATLNPAAEVRNQAEEKLHAWGKNVVPGFLGNLLDIASQRANVAEVWW